MASKTLPHPERERSEQSKDAKAPIQSQQKALRSLPPLREVIARHGLMAKKSLGQNFILDLNVTRRIARAAADDESRPFGGVNVIEVGPGPGGLTRALLETDARRVVAIERDRRALAALQELAAAYPGRLALVEGDALALDPAALTDAPRTIVANLPYNIATALLLRWLDNMGFSAKSPSGSSPRRAARPMAGCRLSCSGSRSRRSCSTCRRAPLCRLRR